jgi:hypothetical protein
VLGLILEVVVLVVWLESLHEVSLLGVLPLMLNTGMGGVVALSWRGGTVHGFPFVVLFLLQLERAGSLVVVFMEVALVGNMFWIVLTPLLSKWLGTGFTLLVLTPVLSHLFALMLVKVVIKFRSVNNIVISPASTESDNKSRNAVTRTDHTKSGNLCIVIPGPRMLKIVVIKLIEPKIDETPDR